MFHNPNETAGTIAAFDFVADAVFDYILANEGNDFYVDTILRRTQSAVLTSGAPVNQDMIRIHDDNENTANSGSLYSIQTQADVDDSGDDNFDFLPDKTYGHADDYDKQSGLGTILHNALGRNSLPSSWDASSALKGALEWNGPSSPGSVLQGGQSYIFYGAMVVDLTVADMSYAEMRDLRENQITDEFTDGGRFYGEAWTVPGTYGWSA